MEIERSDGPSFTIEEGSSYGLRIGHYEVCEIANYAIATITRLASRRSSHPKQFIGTRLTGARALEPNQENSHASIGSVATTYPIRLNKVPIDEGSASLSP